jgi:hypothetical protein
MGSAQVRSGGEAFDETDTHPQPSEARGEGRKYSGASAGDAAVSVASAAPGAVPGDAETISRFRAIGSVLAPTTVITALLFWFGYVSTVAEYRYFGVPLDVVDLSTNELLLHGVEVMYVPLVLALLAVLAIAAVHGMVTWVLAAMARDLISRWIAALSAVIGLLLLFRSMVGIFVSTVAETEYPGGTPLALSLGPVCLLYGAWIWRSVALRQVRADGGASWFQGKAAEQLTKVIRPTVAAVLVVGLFWAVNTFAAAYGSGRGELRAEGLEREPSVVVDTADPLTGVSPSSTVQEFELSPRDDEIFRYRYEGLRLLTESNGRLFLVPAQWRSGDRWTLVVPYNDRIRVRLATE